jgi:hypothetical protein
MYVSGKSYKIAGVIKGNHIGAYFFQKILLHRSQHLEGLAYFNGMFPETIGLPETVQGTCTDPCLPAAPKIQRNIVRLLMVDGRYNTFP